MERPYIVGITGGSASGKTKFLNSLLEAFDPQQICLISQDNYYKPIELQTLDEAGVHNFDIPSSIDFEAFKNDIIAIRAGKSVKRAEYTFNNPDKTAAVITLNPAPIIIVEGIFVFYNPQILELIDLKIFID